MYVYGVYMHVCVQVPTEFRREIGFLEAGVIGVYEPLSMCTAGICAKVHTSPRQRPGRRWRQTFLQRQEDDADVIQATITVQRWVAETAPDALTPIAVIAQ